MRIHKTKRSSNFARDSRIASTRSTAVLVLISEIVWIVHGIWAQSFLSISCANNQRWLRKLWKETIEVTVVVMTHGCVITKNLSNTTFYSNPEMDHFFFSAQRALQSRTGFLSCSKTKFKTKLTLSTSIGHLLVKWGISICLVKTNRMLSKSQRTKIHNILLWWKIVCWQFWNFLVV